MNSSNWQISAISRLKNNDIKGTILLVDDDPSIVNLVTEILNDLLAENQYQLISANSGSEAWSILEKDPELFDIVLLDRQMPGMDGLTVLKNIKAHNLLKLIRVIMQTGLTDSEDIIEGLRAGAGYYLTKPYEIDILKSVVRTAIEEREQYKSILAKKEKSQKIMSMISTADFKIKSLEDASCLAGMLALTSPDPEQAIIGFSELLTNAIEHGNLDIGYEEKTILVLAGKWNTEIQKRLLSDKYKDKSVNVSLLRENKKIEIHIRDQGNGFDWHSYMDFDEKRLFDNHGRGIAMTNKIYFDNLEYRGCGNHVVVYFVDTK